MKIKTYLIIIAICISITSYSQEIPFIKVENEKLGITSLKVNVEVFGNIATTTYDMQFYNPTNKILEGELNFPLGEGQNVVRLALEINGKLREAVVVEKELGRVAFEAVVRRGVDPVLLEKVTGNNYKARIYPIPAKGYKRIVLAFDQKLKYKNTKKELYLPLKFNKELDKFSLDVEVFSQKQAPEIRTNGLELQFLKTQWSYKSTLIEEKYLLDKDLNLYLPTEKNEVPIIRNENCFYISQPIKFIKELRKKPKKLYIFWDMSNSMNKRNIEKEIKLIDTYIQYLQDVTINFVPFSNELLQKQTYKIQNGNWNVLKTVLKTGVYDGATNYSVLEKEITKGIGTTLFFTDLMHNLSDTKLKFKKIVFVINSVRKSNHELAKEITKNNKGNYINLNKITSEEGFQLLKNKKFELIRIETDNQETEIYPKKFQNIANGIHISGKYIKAGQKIRFNFGSNGVVTKTLEYEIPRKKINNSKLDKIFAVNKIKFLQQEKDKNKQEIIALSKGYNVISEFTSMIVLDDVRDYIKYNITPPEDLREAYDKIIKQKNVKVVSATAEPKENKPEENKPENILGEIEVHGVVSDDLGPVADISVKVKGTSKGTSTDFDGRFSIKAQKGDNLVFSHISYGTAETTVLGSNINIRLRTSASNLDEVIITGYDSNRSKRAISASLQKVEENELKTATNVVQTLRGKVAGLEISKKETRINKEHGLVIRGVHSISGNNDALIVIDGVPASNDVFNAMHPDQIKTLTVMKGANGAALYGSRAVNGVIVVTTKRGDEVTTMEPNYEEDIEEKVTNKYSGKLEVEIPKNKAEYLTSYKLLTTENEYYEQYIIQREKYKNYPAFLVDIYDLFIKKGYVKYANRILSNIVELDIDDYEKLKIYAYKLEKQEQNRQAVFIYKKVLELRPEDAQSYRDLALAYKLVNKNKSANKLLKAIVSGEIYKNTHRRNFKGVNNIAKNELKEGKQELDIRVVIDWNHNDTDIDLHIIEPTLEECYYGNQKTAIGGRMSMDMTQGFGPEEYILKNAKRGNYYVKVRYFGDRYQKIENPTFIKITIFKDYGTKNTTKETKVIRLSGRSKDYILAKIKV